MNTNTSGRNDVYVPAPIADNTSPRSNKLSTYQQHLYAARNQVNEMACTIANMLPSIIKDATVHLYDKMHRSEQEQLLLRTVEELITLLHERKYEYPEDKEKFEKIQLLISEGRETARKMEDTQVFNGFSLLESFFLTADKERMKLRSAIMNIYLVANSINSAMHALGIKKKELVTSKIALKKLLEEGNHSGDTFRNVLANTAQLDADIMHIGKQIHEAHEQMGKTEARLLETKSETLPSLEKVLKVYQHLITGNTLDNFVDARKKPLKRLDTPLKTVEKSPNVEIEKKEVPHLETALTLVEVSIQPQKTNKAPVKSAKKSTEKTPPSVDEMLEAIGALSEKEFNFEIFDAESGYLVDSKGEYMIEQEDFDSVQNALVELIENSLTTVKTEEKKSISKELLAVVKVNNITSPVKFLKIVALQLPGLVQYVDDLLVKVVRDTEDVRALQRMRALVMIHHAAVYEFSNEEFSTYLTQYRFGQQKLASYKSNSYFQIHTFNKILKAYEKAGFSIDSLTVENINNVVCFYKVIEQKVIRGEREKGTLIPYLFLVQLTSYLSADLHLIDELHERIPESIYYTKAKTQRHFPTVNWEALLDDLTIYLSRRSSPDSFVYGLQSFGKDTEEYEVEKEDIRYY